jgi:hypothetical protein
MRILLLLRKQLWRCREGYIAPALFYPPPSLRGEHRCLASRVEFNPLTAFGPDPPPSPRYRPLPEQGTADAQGIKPGHRPGRVDAVQDDGRFNLICRERCSGNGARFRGTRNSVEQVELSRFHVRCLSGGSESNAIRLERNTLSNRSPANQHR